MPLLLPTHQEYQASISKLQRWLRDIKSTVEWCIYGSSVHGKWRPWLSDIDIFIYSDTGSILFPAQVSRQIGLIRQQIEDIWIPVQCSYHTKASLSSIFASPDYFYLQEVLGGKKRGYASAHFPEVFHELRDGNIDDTAMARFFLKKITTLPAQMYGIETLLWKSFEDIDFQDQKSLQKFWDSYKKFLSFLSLSLRILEWNSVFSDADGTIFEQCENLLGKDIDFKDYFTVLGKIKNIEDWYYFLKEGGVERILFQYETVFESVIERISEKLSKI